ncbi:MAG: T9SS type A sorting domain-containing protein, partial [Candidatus Latescibacterota bacterium]|nr:T9SS type A sorting domain-containing protein [Candidatus Latescibacterota bacterium]
VTVDALPVVLIDGHVQLRLEQGIHHSLVAVSVSIEDVQKIVQQSIVSLIGGSDGGRFDLPDAGARVEIPVGSGGGLLMQRVEEGVELLLSPRLAADGVGLFLTHTAEGSNRIAAGRTGRSAVVPGARSSGVSGLEWLSPDGWVTVPSWQVSNPPGVYGTVFDSGVYRLAETQGEASALTPVHAFPNPFNAQVTLQFAPTFPGLVELIVYDPLGQPVRQWRFDHPGGVGSLIWDGSDRGGRPVASGIYLLQVKTPGGTHMHKLLLLR